MKPEPTPSTLNSCTAFLVPAFKAYDQLGWREMPIFPAAVAESEAVLGWDAMPTFGHPVDASENAELVADFVRETREAKSKAGFVKSFWNAVSLRA